MLAEDEKFWHALPRGPSGRPSVASGSAADVAVVAAEEEAEAAAGAPGMMVSPAAAAALGPPPVVFVSFAGWGEVACVASLGSLGSAGVAVDAAARWGGVVGRGA